MGKIIKLKQDNQQSNKNRSAKVSAPSNKYYKHSNLTLYRYDIEYKTCLKLFLIHDNFPDLNELIKMPIYEGRKYIKKLHEIYEAQADQRNKSLTGKTLLEEAWEKHMQWFCDLTGDTFDKDKKIIFKKETDK